MRILVSGAHGMIGSAIVEHLRGRGDEVGALVRGTPASPLDVQWDIDAGTIDQQALETGGFDAVAHLAGEPILGRWTDAKREAILRSRVEGTGLLARAIAALDAPPRVLAVASATGFYGDRGEELLGDDAAPGEGFLASVVQAWETAAEPARAAGIRTVHLRMSAVQSAAGGALKEQLLPFKLGLGGRVGPGTQWAPWVGVTEAAAMWAFALDDEAVSGPINAVGPTPCRNLEYTKVLGRALHRPTPFPVPMSILRLRYGGDLVDEMLLVSQKVVPARLEALGYEFLDRTVGDAIRRELGHR